MLNASSIFDDLSRTFRQISPLSIEHGTLSISSCNVVKSTKQISVMLREKGKTEEGAGRKCKRLDLYVEKRRSKSMLMYDKNHPESVPPRSSFYTVHSHILLLLRIILDLLGGR